VFVTGGLYAEALGLTDHGQMADPTRVAALCAAEGVAPLAAIPALVW
jgi:hypothetical protein